MEITHNQFMTRALSLALNGQRMTSPNPMVGCVIVKDSKIIGEGWHHKCGNPHAEIEALNDAHSRGEDVRGSTVYVTLEPCSHYGKTPPCADRLVKEGVNEVFIAMRDPNPKVNGKGIAILREAGIKVTELSEFEEQAKFLNRGFVFVYKYGRPFVTLKAAMSLDGRMCLDNGSSKWITGIEARTEAHRLRAENDAVLVGIGTVL
ncbi:MAG: bifunctional diaminohydroxyphosphoribosylaminopyrimidine deaminase/5-amino-6-(5-phosphoribosylamino)uracil reductase RibD, partial [Synergistaceae bacterium]|nr:bifunctional diaminohydroxyphosphoribosylaminopyrimidine deaminase/5-amino-6-(5-phosphoribosylamino)uracil reductase RibD [Synergistaceae bacterium]